MTGESPSAFSETTRRARKEHDCCECPAIIKPGETYEYASGVWDGHGASHKTCAPCAELRRLFESSVDTGALRAPFGHLFGQLREACSFYDPGWRCLSALVTDEVSAAIVGRAMGLLYQQDLEEYDVEQWQARARRMGRCISLLQAREEMGR